MNDLLSGIIGEGENKWLVIHGWFGPDALDGIPDELNTDQNQFAVLHNPGYGIAQKSAPPQTSPTLRFNY